MCPLVISPGRRVSGVVKQAGLPLALASYRLRCQWLADNSAGSPSSGSRGSSRNKRVRRIDLRWVVNADFLQDWPKDLTKPVARLF